VTGRYSNQLNYRSALKLTATGSRTSHTEHRIGVVGAEGIEPPTFAL
jgi:hypothetical protein